ncbi:MAG: alkaline phosphatase [bacterium]
MRRKINILLLLVLLIFSVKCSKNNMPRNIILFISDGCGYSHIHVTDYYQYGEKGSQVYERFPFVSSMSTYPYGSDYNTEKVWKDFEYLKVRHTDSAAAATAMSTGVKTYCGAICVGPDSTELINVVEVAEEQGLSTGVISSVRFAHATPAGFVAHNFSRDNHQQIAAEMLVESRVEVIMGCGHPWYNQNGESIFPDEKKESEVEYKYVGGKELWMKLLQGTIGNDCDNDGDIEYWKLIQKKEDFQKLAQGEAPERVLGIPQVAHTLQYDRNGTEDNPYQVPFNKNVPNLSEMTRAGLNVLENNEKGFFLMVEGGAVDWAGHNNKSARMIEEEIDFNCSVEAAVEWVEEKSNWSETLIIVTADHECGYLWGPGSGGKREKGEPFEKVWKPVVNNGQGNLPEMQWFSGSHSNSLVPIFAKGRGWKILKKEADEQDYRYGSFLDNAELGKFLLNMLKQ